MKRAPPCICCVFILWCDDHVGSICNNLILSKNGHVFFCLYQFNSYYLLNCNTRNFFFSMYKYRLFFFLANRVGKYAGGCGKFTSSLMTGPSTDWKIFTPKRYTKINRRLFGIVFTRNGARPSINQCKWIRKSFLETSLEDNGNVLA